MPEQIDHRSAVVRLLHHHGVEGDCFDSVMFHYDQAIEQAKAEGREQCIQLIREKYMPEEIGK